MSFLLFSPSSLESYIKNPKDYYFQKLLNLKTEEVDEGFASHKIIGLVFHETIEFLYKPFIGKYLEKKALKESLLNTDKVLKLSFVRNNEPFDSGKNLIIFEVIKSALNTFINNEIEDLNNGNGIKIIALEKSIKGALKLNQGSEVLITGIIDRVDERNGITRVIDYKTGLVSSSNLTIKDMSLICKDPLRTKAMQLMCYSWMYFRSTKCEKISAISSDAVDFEYSVKNPSILLYNSRFQLLLHVEHSLYLKSFLLNVFHSTLLNSSL